MGRRLPRGPSPLRFVSERQQIGRTGRWLRHRCDTDIYVVRNTSGRRDISLPVPHFVVYSMFGRSECRANGLEMHLSSGVR